MPFRRWVQMAWVVALLLTTGACATFGGSPESKFTTKQLRDMGEKFLDGGSLGQALKMLTEAEARVPRDPEIQYLLGRGYEGRGMDTQALEHYRKAVILKPDYAEAHNALGVFYAKRGDLYKAEDHFKLALNNPFYETPQIVYYNLGLLYERRDETEDALAQFQKAVRLAPDYGQAYYHMGLMLEKLRRADEARDAYGKAIEYDPNLVEAQFRFGVICYTAGEMENAIHSLSQVVKLAPYSTMGTEARQYLERLQGAMGGVASRSSSLSPSERISHMDVINEQDLQRRESPIPPDSARTEAKNSSTPVEKLLSPRVEPEPEPDQASLPPNTHWAYIVQLGSFLDKENAELMRQRLKTKGYDPIVKPVQHQVLGQVYIVQLHPVKDESKASTLMAQVERVEKVRPIIIIKVPESN